MRDSQGHFDSSLEMTEKPSSVNGHTPLSTHPTSPITPVSPVTPSSTSPNSPTTARAHFAYPQPASQPIASSSTPSSSRKVLSTHIQNHPNDSVGTAIRKQFPLPNPLFRLVRRFHVKHSVIEGLTNEEMAKWEKEGKSLRDKAGWKLEGEEGDGAVVSELFWKMYLSLMPTLERDPLSGLVPPDLLGSTTTMPLSIISLIPDIMQHYRDVIIRAKKEVFLATNYWQPSNSVNTISKALKDLSAIVVKEKREKVIVKVMYDRGSWEQLWNAHAPVKPAGWTPLDLPGKDDIPGLDMEVINFHRVLLGTFHAKFLIVDRKVALLNSNNIQDRPNLELMSHFEGPIVDSFYEVALHSWYNRLSPPLPCMSKPYQPPTDAAGRIRYLFKDRNPYFDEIEVLKAAKAARLLLRKQTKENEEKALGHADEHRFRDAVAKVVERQRQARADWAEWKPGEELNARAQTALNELRELGERWGLGGTSRAGSRANSRANSRGPSRRASADLVYKAGQFTDRETAAITAQNAHASSVSPVDPSEAPSTPTVIGDAPMKSKTFPTPSSPQREHIQLHDFETTTVDTAENDRGRKGHVLFLDTTAIDGSGRLFDNEGEVVQSPQTARSSFVQGSSLLGVTGREFVVDSPATSSIRLPQNETRAVSPLAPVHLGPVHSVEPATPTSNGYAHEPTNEAGEVLPATAQMPTELDPSQSADPERPPVRRSESEVPEGMGSKRMFKMSKMFNAAGVLSEAWATVEDSDELDNFKPHVVHEPHEPFPIAMCCRKPHGFPGHHDIRNPQNAAWLAGFRYAKKKVFVQTPTLNARPIVRAIKQACRRGVEVVLLLDLGFNDKGESIPFQGGTNEEVVDRLYKILSKDKKQQFLKVYWYTGKDQVRPLNAVKKQRNCHIKFAAYDDEVMIIGNGNQDSQSWFHSQEVNVMIDSKQVIAEMMEQLLANQNTIKYGLVDTDGIWRDEHGKTLGDYGATEKGAFRGLSGFIAFAKTI